MITKINPEIEQVPQSNVILPHSEHRGFNRLLELGYSPAEIHILRILYHRTFDFANPDSDKLTSRNAER